MKRKMGLVCALLTLLFSGCATYVPYPATELAEPTRALVSWEEVLNKYVDDSGRIDFYGVAKNPEALHRYVRYVASTSPKLHPEEFPTREAKLAFYLNSYNALAMYNVIQGGIPESFSGSLRAKYFLFRSLDVGSYYYSLFRYENEIIRPLGDERVHFALNCMVKGCPRLPRKPFLASSLDQELDAEAKRFLNEERNVKIDEAAKKVYFSSILKFYTGDFLTKAPTLIVYANRYRTVKIPEDYAIDFIPYDWTTNFSPNSHPN